MKYQITDQIIWTQDQFTSFTADQEHEMRRKKKLAAKFFNILIQTATVMHITRDKPLKGNKPKMLGNIIFWVSFTTETLMQLRKLR